MAKVEDVARGALAALNSEAGYLLAAKWTADRYRQIAARTRLRHLREVGELIVPGIISAGIATFTKGSLVVTGDATAQAAWPPSVASRFIRARTVWYEIANLTTAGEIHLRSAFAEDSVAGSYKITQRFSPVDARARWLGDVIVHARRRTPLGRASLEMLDAEAPERPLAGGSAPTCWAEVGSRVTPDGVVAKVIEVYPYASTDELYHYVFYPTVPTLGLQDELPPEIDEHVLREGVLIDAMRWEAAKAIRAGGLEAAAFWRNEYRAQETRWERTILDAFRASAATDDLQFILTRTGSSRSSDIATARDEVFARGNRP